MRTCLLLVLFGLIFSSVAGQDKILTRDNKQLNVKIVENTGKLVKYKMPDYPDGPVITLKASRIEKIEYKNGVIDLMGNQNPRKDKPLGISIGGAKWISSSGLMFTSTMDYFLTSQVDMEVNMGADSQQILYLSAGARLHINPNYSEKRITPFTGVLLGYEYNDGFLQIPIGVNYIHKAGINISLSVNEMIFTDQYQTIIELRGGWRFKL